MSIYQEILYLHGHRGQINKELKQKYTTLDKKLENLKAKQLHDTSNCPPQNFYLQVLNNTTVDFTSEELALLNNGMKHNLHYKQKRWITTLALEAETAISLLPALDQDPIRYLVNKNIQHLFRSMGKQPYKNNRE